MKPTSTIASLRSAKSNRVTRRRMTGRPGVRSTAIRGLLIAGAATLGVVQGTGLGWTNQVATAAECDCWEETCDSCGPRQNAMKNCLIYKSLDALAGGIEKVLCLDKSRGCDEFGCDGACDAAYMEDLMEPVPSVVHPSAPIHVQRAVPSHVHATPHYVPAPPANVFAPPAATPIPYAEEVPAVMPDVPDGQHLGQPDSHSQPLEMAQPPVDPVPQPSPDLMPEPAPKQDGSLFDALDDPFSDDDVRTYRPYRNVRPSGYLQRAGSANSYRRTGSAVRPSTQTPARKATHRTPTPVLNAPVRQTSAIQRHPIGSGVAQSRQAIHASPTNHTPTSQRPSAVKHPQTFNMQSRTSTGIVELTPTDYLNSQRSANSRR